MKVAIVHSFYSSAVPSGENIVVRAQLEALQQRGVEVRLIAASTDELSSDIAYPVRTALKVATGFGRSPLPDIEAFQPDIVHVHNLFPNWGTSWLRRWPGKVVATVHNYRPACAAGTLFREGHFCDLCPREGSHNAVMHSCYKGSKLATVPLAIQNRRGAKDNPLLRRADRVIVLSSRARRLYESFGVDADKIVFIPNFVEDEGFNPTAPRGSHWVYIGRLSEEKGIVELVQNWPAGPVLRIYGDGVLRPKVSKYCGPNMHLLGPVDRTVVPDVLSQAKGLIFPSLTSEGAIPLTYVEALAAGRPTLSRSGNGAGDDIATFGTGQVFNEWSEIPGKIAMMNQDIGAVSLKARKHYENRFTSAIWAEEMLSLYRKLIV